VGAVPPPPPVVPDPPELVLDVDALAALDELVSWHP